MDSRDLYSKQMRERIDTGVAEQLGDPLHTWRAPDAPALSDDAEGAVATLFEEWAHLTARLKTFGFSEQGLCEATTQIAETVDTTIETVERDGIASPTG
jgi:hypothetical protein